MKTAKSGKSNKSKDSESEPNEIEEFYSAVDHGATHLLRDYLAQGLDQPPLVQYALNSGIENNKTDIIQTIFEHNWKDPLLVMPSLCIHSALLLKSPLYLEKFLAKGTYTAPDLVKALLNLGGDNLKVKECLKKTPPHYLKYITEIEWENDQVSRYEPIVETCKEILNEMRIDAAIKKLKGAGVGSEMENTIEI